MNPNMELARKINMYFKIYDGLPLCVNTRKGLLRELGLIPETFEGIDVSKDDKPIKITGHTDNEGVKHIDKIQPFEIYGESKLYNFMCKVKIGVEALNQAHAKELLLNGLYYQFDIKEILEEELIKMDIDKIEGICKVEMCCIELEFPFDGRRIATFKTKNPKLCKALANIETSGLKAITFYFKEKDLK